ncbi:NnrS family protein [Stutzerimonas balearica]|uniref:NnrS family protein n=1 Tax=Stutzerimonas balearica TaxID=74829 RepID=UPI0028AE76AD|nr:NnrS family protein [Stutzerimonas balearica]
MSPPRPRQPFASDWFFPAAALHAALILPLSVLSLLGLLPALPGLLTPAAHAREMLFGYGLAVVAGYLLGPQPRPLIAALLAGWLLARLGHLFWPDGPLGPLASALFAAGLAWRVVPRFLGAAKKWRNQMVAPTVAGLALLSAVMAWFHLVQLPANLRLAALMLFAGLLFFMGGRIIAPALAGHAQSQGRRLEARVQPQLEGAVLLLLAGALLLAFSPWPLPRRVAGGLLCASALLSAIRLVRWQPWHCRTRNDLLAPLLGYAWLALGLLLLGAPLSAGHEPPTPLLHALTVGALGTLSFSVMARTWLTQRFRDANARPWIYPFALCISLAALIRLLAPASPAALAFAAGSWSLAFLALATLFWRSRGQRRARRREAE